MLLTLRGRHLFTQLVNIRSIQHVDEFIPSLPTNERIYSFHAASGKKNRQTEVCFGRPCHTKKR